MEKTSFVRITVNRVAFSFRLNFRHNLAERSDDVTLLVKIETDDGRVGYGQIIPRSYLTGEDLDGALADVRTRWWPALRELSFAAGDVSENLPENFRKNGDGVEKAWFSLYEAADRERRTAGYAGVDVAARMALCPAVRAANPESGRVVELVASIPAVGCRKAAWLARVLRWLGYRRFKVKVGADELADARRVGAVRRAAGSGAWLAADANAAWEWDEAVRRMRDLKKRFGVEVVEEPLTKGAAAGADFKVLEREAGVAAMADESLCTRADAEGLLARGSPSWWNIRLAKNGGFNGAKALARMAAEAGVRVYGGILVGETGALAAASRIIMYETGAECGEYGFSRVFLRGDPFRRSPAGYGGAYSRPAAGEWAGVVLPSGVMPGKRVFSDGTE